MAKNDENLCNSPRTGAHRDIEGKRCFKKGERDYWINLYLRCVGYT